MTSPLVKAAPLVAPPPRPWLRRVPATSERALSNVGIVCFHAFLAAQFLSLTRLFFAQHLGEGVSTVASVAGLYSVFLLVPAVLTCGLRAGSVFGTLTRAARLWVTVVGALSLFLFFYGWLEKGYVVTAVAHDLAPYVVLLSTAILGSIPSIWPRTDRVIVAFFLLALAVNVVGMTEITTVVSEDHADDRSGTATLAYRTQGALAFWPFLFLTAMARRRFQALAIFAGVFFVLAQQILFQKRSPTFRIALFVLLFLFVLPRLRSRTGNAGQGRGTRRAFALMGAVAVVVAIAVAPWLFEGQIAGLARRISGQAYSGGAVGMLTTENERFFEASMFFRTLEAQEYVFGRGFGGAFVPDTPGWGVWLSDVGDFGRRQLHVGGLMPFFKGGLALAFAYYAGLFLALVRGRRALRDSATTAAFFVVLLHTLFLLQEGWFIMSLSFDLTLVGLCMGHLLSNLRVVPTSVSVLRQSVARSLSPRSPS